MSYTLYYHSKCEGFTGRGFPALAMCKHAGKEIVVKAPEDAPAGIGFAVPILTFPEGHTISQTVPIAMYLGKALGLAPTTDAEGAKALQVVMDGLDMNTESGQDKPAERINKWYAHMTMLLGDKDFFCGATPMYPDFVMYMPFKMIKLKQAKDKWAGYEPGAKLEAWVARMDALPAIAELSKIPMLPDSFI